MKKSSVFINVKRQEMIFLCSRRDVLKNYFIKKKKAQKKHDETVFFFRR